MARGSVVLRNKGLTFVIVGTWEKADELLSL